MLPFCHCSRMVILETRQTDDQSGLSNLYILEEAVNYVMVNWLISMTGPEPNLPNQRLRRTQDEIEFALMDLARASEDHCLATFQDFKNEVCWDAHLDSYRQEAKKRQKSSNTKEKHLFHAATVFSLPGPKNWQLKDATFKHWELERCVFCCLDLCASFAWTIQLFHHCRYNKVLFAYNWM